MSESALCFTEQKKNTDFFHDKVCILDALFFEDFSPCRQNGLSSSFRAIVKNSVPFVLSSSFGIPS